MVAESAREIEYLHFVFQTSSAILGNGETSKYPLP